MLGSWAAALLVATSGKLIAATSILAETTRSVNPYFGSQDSHWFIVHLAFPFFSAVPGLPNFSYGPGQAGWGWGWWEYTQYIGFLPVVLALLVVGAILFELVRRKVLVSHGLRHREIAALLGVVLLAVLWLANAQWYSPVHWLFEAVPPLQRFRVPSRSLVLVAPVFLALAAIALEESLRWRPGRFSVIAACLAFTGLVGAWWVNTSWFNPVQWFCNGIPGLNGAPTPVCLAVLAAIGLLSLMAFAYWARRLTAQGRYRVVVTGLALAAVLALGDVFHATRANLQVREGPSADRIRRVAEELKLRDPGPILVGLGATGKKYFGNTGMYVNKSVKFELVDRGIAVAEDVSPLWPKQQSQHRVIGLDKRLRYRIAPSEPEPVIEKGWSRLMQDGDVVVLVNDQADGDAWLVSSGRSSPQISPLKVSDWAPGRFTVSAYAPVDAIVAVPANAFRGWHVSVDGGPLQQAIEFDGYVASDAYSGQHTYRFVYKAPYLPAILVLGALPWILALGLGVLGAVVWLRRNTGAAESI